MLKRFFSISKQGKMVNFGMSQRKDKIWFCYFFVKKVPKRLVLHCLLWKIDWIFWPIRIFVSLLYISWKFYRNIHCHKKTSKNQLWSSAMFPRVKLVNNSWIWSKSSVTIMVLISTKDYHWSPTTLPWVYNRY